MKILSLFIAIAVVPGIVNALSIEHENAKRRQPEHYSYNQKTDSEIQSDMYYQRAEQERLEQQQREQQRKERQRLDQQRRQLQMENQRKPRPNYDDYQDYDSQRQSMEQQRSMRQRMDRQRLEQRQLELQIQNQRIQNEMEQERQQQIIREFYH